MSPELQSARLVTVVGEPGPIMVREFRADPAAEFAKAVRQIVQLGWTEFKRQWRAANANLQSRGNEQHIDGGRDSGVGRQVKPMRPVLKRHPYGYAAGVLLHSRFSIVEVRYHHLSPSWLWKALMVAARSARKQEGVR
jgi:hypothetical protein